jgi:branched-chain amino acid transport system substrate-binding protein
LAKTTENVKIGAVLPLTGDAAFLGKSGQRGLLLAEKYINDNRIIGYNRNIKIIFQDGMADPKTSLGALNHLLLVDRVNIVFSIISSVDLSILPIQKKEHFLFISHATHPSLSGINDLVFRHSPTVEQEFKIIQNSKAFSSPTILLYMNDDYGEAFKKLAVERRLIKESSIYSFAKGEVDFKALATKALLNKSRSIIICGTGKNLSALVKTLREQGYNGRILTSLGFKVSGAYDICKSDKFLSFVDFENQHINQKYKSIIDFYKQKYHSDITVSELIFFNSALMIAESIQKKNAAPNAIAFNLKKTKTFKAMGEDVTISPKNDMLPKLVIRNN